MVVLARVGAGPARLVVPGKGRERHDGCKRLGDDGAVAPEGPEEVDCYGQLVYVETSPPAVEAAQAGDLEHVVVGDGKIGGLSCLLVRRWASKPVFLGALERPSLGRVYTILHNRLGILANVGPEHPGPYQGERLADHLEAELS